MAKKPAIDEAEEEDGEDEELAQLRREGAPEAEEVHDGALELRGKHERHDHRDRVQHVADHALGEAGKDAARQDADDHEIDPAQPLEQLHALHSLIWS